MQILTIRPLKMIFFFAMPFFFTACSKKSGTDSPVAGLPPIVNSMSPISGGVGTIITLQGVNFDNDASKDIVTVNGVPATVLNATNTEIKVMVPVTTSGFVELKTPSGSDKTKTFTYIISAVTAGSQVTTGGGVYSFASYWNNGTMYNLTDGTSNAAALGATTLGPDFLVVGQEFYGGNNIAKIWKNGIATSLASLSNKSSATCIATSGNDIFIGGFINPGNYKIATVWKNGVANSLTGGTSDAQINGIAVSGTDVYACGYETGTNGKTIAKVWKNGVGTNLTTGQYFAGANGITISGSDVLVAGYETSANFGDGNYGILWKNGSPNYLLAPPYNTYANAITVSGIDVYVVGHYYDSNTPASKSGMWKNGVFNYPSSGGDLTAVVLDGVAVYVAGYGYAGGDPAAGWIPKYWKNNTEYTLTDNTKRGIASAIIYK